MNNDNKVETAIAGLNCWASYATEDHLTSYNLFCRILVNPFHYEIFGFIRYANNTTCDITSHIMTFEN